MTPAPNCKPLLADLRKRAESLGPAVMEMYREGIWTGYLNALDENSPHCATSVAQADYFHSKALKYLARWVALHATVGDDACTR